MVLLPIGSSPKTKPSSSKDKQLFTVPDVKISWPKNTTPLLAFVIIGANIIATKTKLPIQITHLLAEFAKITESTNSLSPLRNIQHTIDLMLGSTLLNLPHYRINPREYQILQGQLKELLSKGHIQLSLSPCAILALLAPKKMIIGGFMLTVKP